MEREVMIIVKRLETISRKRGATGLPIPIGTRFWLDIRRKQEHTLMSLSRLGACLASVSKIARIGKSVAHHGSIEIIDVADQSGQWLKDLKGSGTPFPPSVVQFGFLDGQTQYLNRDRNQNLNLCPRERLSELHLLQLRNVKSGEEAGRGMLKQKKHVQALALRWGWDDEWDGTPRDLDDEVLEALQPHPNLKWLIITDHCGAKLPSWLENQWLLNLEMVELYSCLTWDFPLPLGKLPCLKHLHIEASQFTPLYANITYWYRSLGNIQSYGTQGWEDDARLFPNLRVLRISHCGRVENLPPLPPTLTDLYINKVYLTSLPGLWGYDSSPSALSSVHISDCNNLTTLHQGLIQNRLEALESLTISDCCNLESFPKDGLRSLVSLRSLNLEDCNGLTWPADSGGCLPSSLVYLKISKCRGIAVDSFFMGLRNLTSLTSLHIEGMEVYSFNTEYVLNLESLPGELLRHLTALTELEIMNCPKLVMFGFQALPSLQQLKIYRCDNIDLVPPSYEGCIPPPLECLKFECTDIRFLSCELLQNMRSLKKLYLDSCSLNNALDELVNLTSLEELCIADCYGLKSLPEKGFPISLVLLVINCRQFPSKDLKEGGSDWHKIAHILYVSINGREIETEASKQL